MSDKAQALEQSLQQQIDRIDDAIIKTRNNETVNISDMDGHVAAICQEIVNADNDIVQALEPKMLHMINRLDELADELRQYQDRAGAKE